MRRTLTVVFDDIGEWSNSYGTFYSVGGLFDDGTILQANKKERHYAQELRETLLQLVDIECDFICDDAGQSKNGNQKWKLKAITDLEGGPIYGNPPNVGVRQEASAGSATPAKGLAAPGVTPTPPNVGAGRSDTAVVGSKPTTRTLPPASTHSDKDAEIRAAVALKAAVECVASQMPASATVAHEAVLTVADTFNEWLESKSSGHVQSSEARPPSATTPAGPDSSGDTKPDELRVDTPTTSAGADLGEASAPAGPTSEGVAVSGKDPAPSGPKRYTGSPPPGWVGTE